MIRTPDFFVPNEALYQTEPHPEIDIKLLVGRFFLRKNLRPEGRARRTEPHPEIDIKLLVGRFFLRKNLRPEGRAHQTEPHPDIVVT